MKQFKILFLMLVLVLASCSETEVIINNERVTCGYHPGVIISDIKDGPISRVSNLREIIYEFSTDGDIINGVVLENEPLYVDLIKGKTYTAKFFYADSIENDTVIIYNENVYGFTKDYKIENPVSDTITLTRKIGLITAKVGHIPANTYVNFEVSTYNKFNWKYGYIFTDSFTKDTCTHKVSNDSISKYGAISEGNFITATVKVSLYNKHNKLVKEGTYNYPLLENRNKIVTYNINNSNTEYGEFVIDINETWGEDDNHDQQIGK